MSESVGSYTLYIDGKVLAQIAKFSFLRVSWAIPYHTGVTIFRGEMTHDQNIDLCQILIIIHITGMVYLPIHANTTVTQLYCLKKMVFFEPFSKVVTHLHCFPAALRLTYAWQQTDAEVKVYIPFDQSEDGSWVGSVKETAGNNME